MRIASRAVNAAIRFHPDMQSTHYWDMQFFLNPINPNTRTHHTNHISYTTLIHISLLYLFQNLKRSSLNRYASTLQLPCIKKLLQPTRTLQTLEKSNLMLSLLRQKYELVASTLGRSLAAKTHIHQEAHTDKQRLTPVRVAVMKVVEEDEVVEDVRVSRSGRTIRPKKR